MMNYEANKEVIDKIWKNNDSIAINRGTNEIVPCMSILMCRECLFNGVDCFVNVQKWLVSQAGETPKGF